MAKKKRTQTAPETASPIDLTPLARQAQLADLRLLGSMCSVALKGAMPSELTQTVAAGAKRSLDGMALIARISLSLSGSNADGSDGLQIGATFGLTYNFPSLENMTDEMMNGFCRVIGLNNVWPYWREFVQSTMGRMGLPPFHVPLLKLNELVEIKEQQPDVSKPTAKSKRKATR
jgi:hypothetical protein